MIPKIAQWHFGTLDVISLSTSVGSENEQFDCLHWLDGSRSRCNTTQAKLEVSRPSIAVEVGHKLSEVECHDVPRGGTPVVHTRNAIALHSMCGCYRRYRPIISILGHRPQTSLANRVMTNSCSIFVTTRHNSARARSRI